MTCCRECSGRTVTVPNQQALTTSNVMPAAVLGVLLGKRFVWGRPIAVITQVADRGVNNEVGLLFSQPIRRVQGVLIYGLLRPLPRRLAPLPEFAHLVAPFLELILTTNGIDTGIVELLDVGIAVGAGLSDSDNAGTQAEADGDPDSDNKKSAATDHLSPTTCPMPPTSLIFHPSPGLIVTEYVAVDCRSCGAWTVLVITLTNESTT